MNNLSHQEEAYVKCLCWREPEKFGTTAEVFQSRKKNYPYTVFPYVVTLQNDYYTFDEINRWCEQEFGFMNGECDRDDLYRVACQYADLDPESYGEKVITKIHNMHHYGICDENANDTYLSFDRQQFINWCGEEVFNSFVQPTTYKPEQGRGPGARTFTIKDCEIETFIGVMRSLDENKIADILANMLEWDDWSSYPHSHIGIWTNRWLGKTGYDYGFQDYCFKNLSDAIIFKTLYKEI